MKVFDTAIPDVKIIKPTVYGDERGYFFEAYNAQKFKKLIGFCPDFCQSNESGSIRGTIRGLHLQKAPFAQAKLVRVVSGEVLDVAVDCRLNSSSYGKHISIILSSDNKKQLYIPKGFAHGFQVLSDECILSYSVDAPYDAPSELEIDCFDNDLAIKWHACEVIRMSKKDSGARAFSQITQIVQG